MDLSPRPDGADALLALVLGDAQFGPDHWQRGDSLSFRQVWPRGKRFGFVLTHDVETAAGQAHVRAVADLDESFGFRASFNFVPKRYRLDHGQIRESRERGFEIGVHELKHDGKLFSSHAELMRRAERISEHLDADVKMRSESYDGGLLAEWDAADFAHNTIYVLEHPDVSRQLGENAKQVAETKHDWRVLIV